MCDRVPDGGGPSDSRSGETGLVSPPISAKFLAWGASCVTSESTWPGEEHWRNAQAALQAHARI